MRLNAPWLRRGARAPALAAERSCARDRSGAAVVELALIVPALVGLLLVVVEFGTMLMAQGLLDAAALRAARTGTTGFTPDGSSRESFIRTFVAEQAYGLLKPEKIGITATSYGSFGDIDKPGKGSPGFGASGQIVVYKLSYPWTGLMPLVGEAVARREINLTASLAVKNEAW